MLVAQNGGPAVLIGTILHRAARIGCTTSSTLSVILVQLGDQHIVDTGPVFRASEVPMPAGKDQAGRCSTESAICTLT